MNIGEIFNFINKSMNVPTSEIFFMEIIVNWLKNLIVACSTLIILGANIYVLNWWVFTKISFGIDRNFKLSVFKLLWKQNYEELDIKKIAITYIKIVGFCIILISGFYYKTLPYIIKTCVFKPVILILGKLEIAIRGFLL